MAGDAMRDGDLLAMLDEAHPVYRGRGAAEAEQLRARLMVQAAEAGLADRLVERATADLETAQSAVLLAAAAVALRHARAAPARALDLLAAAQRRLRAEDRLVDLTRFPPQPGGVSAAGEIARALDDLAQREATAPAFRRPDCCCHEAEDSPPAITSLAAFAELEIENQNGVRRTLGEALGGGPGLIAFFYTRCMNPLRCSKTVTELGHLARALEDLPEAGRIRLAGITYDPAFDLPDRLLAYGRDRSVPFGETCQLLRVTGPFAPVAEAIGLGVGYGPTTVNLHRVEWLVLGPELTVARVGQGRQWENDTMAEELIGLAHGCGRSVSAPRAS